MTHENNVDEIRALADLCENFGGGQRQETPGSYNPQNGNAVVLDALTQAGVFGDWEMAPSGNGEKSYAFNKKYELYAVIPSAPAGERVIRVQEVHPMELKCFANRQYLFRSSNDHMADAINKTLPPEMPFDG